MNFITTIYTFQNNLICPQKPDVHAMTKIQNVHMKAMTFFNIKKDNGCYWYVTMHLVQQKFKSVKRIVKLISNQFPPNPGRICYF